MLRSPVLSAPVLLAIRAKAGQPKPGAADPLHMHNQALIEDFGQRIRELQTPLLPEEGWMRSRRGGGSRGLSQEKLAELTGFHRTYIGMVERGERNISLSNIGVFAKTFGMSVAKLFDFKAERGER